MLKTTLVTDMLVEDVIERCMDLSVHIFEIDEMEILYVGSCYNVPRKCLSKEVCVIQLYDGKLELDVQQKRG